MTDTHRPNLLELALQHADHPWGAGEVVVLVEDHVFLITSFDTVDMRIYDRSFGLGVGLLVYYRDNDTWHTFQPDRLETEYNRWAGWARAWFYAKGGRARRRIEISAQSAERRRMHAALTRGENLPL